jgi:uncharacterized integral membrane protein
MILIALVIALLDINLLCDYAIPHILYPNKRNYIAYASVIITLIIDIYMYYSQVNELVMPDYRYKVEKFEGTECDAYVKNLNNQIDDWNDICKKNGSRFNGITTKVMLSILAIFLMIIVVLCFVIKNENMETNSLTFKLIFAAPLALIAISVMIYAFKDIQKIFTEEGLTKDKQKTVK